ncbi:MAG: PIN domain-containing protein [Acidobacteriota bacterium]
MPIYTFDTSVVIAYRIRELPNNFLLSAVVIAELTASATDDSSRKVFESMRQAYEKLDALIVPVAEDWLTASRVLYWLSRSRKTKGGGKTPKLGFGASQRMFLDALLAVSARRRGATVVTNNYDDFKAIRYYCPVKVLRGSDYFSG